MLKSIFAAIAIFIASIFGGHQVAAPSLPAAVAVAVVSNETPSTSQSGAALTNSTPDISVTNDPEASPSVTPPVPTVTNITVTGVSEEELTAKLANLSNSLQLLVSNSVKTPQLITTFTGNTIPPNLTSPLTAADIPTDITVSNYLLLGGGTLTGALVNSSTAPSSFLGALGIGTTSPSDLFAVNGPIYLADISPAATANRLYSNAGDLYWAGSLVGGGSVGNWTTSGGNVYRASGNVGIGTTNPQAALDLSNSSPSYQSVLDLKGTDESVYGEYPAQLWEIANGSVTTPVTTAGSTFKISRYDNVASTTCLTNGLPNKNDSGCDSALEVSSFSGSTGDMITNGILVGAQNSRTAKGSDAIALSASGRVTGSGTGVGTGAYLEGFRNTTTAMAEGAELTAWNDTSTDCLGFNVSGFSQCTGGWFASRGNGSTFVKDSVALAVGTGDGKSNWLTGLGFTTNSVASTTIDDESSADTSIKINGTHTNALIVGPTAGSVGIGTLTPSYTLDVAGFINTNANFGFKQAGNTVLFASSTNSLTSAGISALANYFNTTSTGGETAFGYQALGNATSSTLDVAIGYQALKGSATVSSVGGNTAVGYQALTLNSSGIDNVAIGQGALAANTSASFSTAVGQDALLSATGNGANSAFGQAALVANTTGINNTGLGISALRQNQTGSFNTAVGGYAGNGVASNSFADDSLFGYTSGFALTTGSDNVFLGFQAASTTSTGANNILIGSRIDLPSVNGSNQLNIGNLVYGTGLNGTYSTISTGNIGIGTTTPYSRLTVWGPDSASSTLAFNVVNSASTTVFAVFDGGNAQLSGTLTQSSDQRLKTNIQSLDASSSLSLIDALNPVTFNWIDPNQGTGPQVGFIAQQVQPLFPAMVSTTSATALTPGGTLGLNYIGLISPIVSAIHALYSDVQSLEQTVAGFAESLVSNRITASQELCVGSTCVTPAQFQAMVAAANQSPSAAQPSPTGGTNPPESVTQNSASTTPNTPPTIIINGDNPAIITVGNSYADLGATVSDTGQGQAGDPNLGLKYFLNGALVSNIVLDTSAVATDTIDYVATDTLGNTATSTRTVIVEVAQASGGDTSNTASTTATSTSQ